MRSLRRRPAPDPVVAAVPRARGDRVLAAAASGEDTWVLATLDAFAVVRDGVLVERLAWPEVEHAEWDRDEEQLVVSAVGEYARPRATYRLPIADPGRLLEVVRERVSASVVLQRRVSISGRVGLFVIARRPPRGTGQLAWMYEFDAGVDPEDPEVRRLAEQGLAAAKEELGL